jgi:2'-5' RNA ligase
LTDQIETAHRLLSEDHGWPLRLIRPENWHVTLLFFEGLEQQERNAVWEEVARGVEDGMKDTGKDGPWRAPDFTWQGLALWPSPRRPSLLCLEAEPFPAGAAYALRTASAPCAKGNVEHYLAYRPHATVMRFRGRGGRRSLGREWRELRESLPEFDSGKIRCDRVSMFLSTLSGDQPVYPREFTLPLVRG